MHQKFTTHFSLCFSMILMAFSIVASANGDPNESSAYFSLDECHSNSSDLSFMDYSEFTADVNESPDGPGISIVGGNLYRANASVNHHSCTPGVGGSAGMCFTAVDDCDFDATSTRSVRIDVMVTPGANGVGMLTGISFYEQGIPTFDWIDGDSGENDYPTLFAVQVLKDGAVVYSEEGLETTTDWSEVNINFGADEDLIVNEATEFQIRLTGYCLVGNGAPIAVWDIDEVTVTASDSGVSGGTLEGGPFEFCVGDGVADNIPAGSITLSDNSGANSQWVVTDDQGNILGLPPMPSVVDFDGAGGGTCLIWHLSYDGTITGAEVGMNANDIEGCFSLSNSIAVVRNQPAGGTLEGGPFEFCVGDGIEDNIPEDAISLSGASGPNSQWVVTDDQGNILGLPPTFSVVNFDGAGAGTCLVWHLSFYGDITGAEVGMNAANLGGCYSLSNSIAVVRNQPAGGTLEGGPFEFCVGDGEADNIPEDAITLSGNSGPNSQWVVTDDQGNILGLPPTFAAVNFDGAGAGTCLVWHLSFAGDLTGAEVGMNAADLGGCYSLSNSIAVVRNQPAGGTLEGGPFEFCVGDGEADMLMAGDITLSGNAGANSQWIITELDGTILGLPPMPSVVDFDGAGAGTCLIWHLSYDGDIEGAMMGANANDLEGCFSLSNPIEVIRNQPAGGTLEGGPFEFCVGDGEADMLMAGDITLSGNTGANSQWVITELDGTILGLPPMPSVVDFDGAGAGTCLIWHLSYDGDIEGAMMGANANDLEGCFSLSNPIEVIRNQPAGGTLEGGPFEFCVGDGEADMLMAGDITLSGNTGANSQWVITELDGTILGLPPMPSVVDFDGAGAGTCLIWHLSYDGDIEGAMMGANANDLEGCFSLSNPIEVIRNQPAGGTLEGGPFEFCVGDGEADMLMVGDITLSGNTGANSQWVITELDGTILGLPPMPSVVDFDGAGVGVCLIWHLSYDGAIEGAMMGANANDLEGCFSLSNPIEVNRIDCNNGGISGGTLEGGPFEFCVGDGEEDNVSGITLNGNTGMNNQWIITEEDGTILGLPPMPGVVNFDGAGAGICLIWNVSYDGMIEGLEMGANANDLEGDFGLSNAISVVRNQPAGGTLEGGPFEFCVGDGEADMLMAGDITLSGDSGAESQWIVTELDGTILGLPPMPSVVDFDGAGVGTCLIWHLSYDGTIEGLEMNANANDLEGCFSLSNAIEVNRIDCGNGGGVSGGVIEGGPFEFCVGDGEEDNVSGITLNGNTGMNNQWIITEEDGTILGLPPMPGVVNFDEAGAGICLIWHVSYDGTIEGLEMGANANDLVGDFGLSNSISVVRNQPEGGILEGGPFEFCVGDDEADMLMAGDITLSGDSGAQSQWIVTELDGTILGLPPMPSVVDFDGAGVGVCLIWHLSYDGDIEGLEMNANANDLEGCFSLSNAIEVNRIDCGSGGVAVIVVNEINDNDEVEITNTGDAGIDISNYWLCDFPSYTQLSNLDIVCGGDLFLDPGEIVTVNAGFDISSADGEMGLYTTNSFGSSDAMIDYVEWGSTGHTRSSVAVAAGIWTTGDFVEAFDAANSLEYDGEGDSSTDWSEDTASPCEDNFTTNIGEVSYSIFPNPASESITLEFTEFTEQESNIDIFDALGNRIESTSHNMDDGATKTMSVAHYRGGAYFVRVTNGKANKVQRFIRAGN